MAACDRNDPNFKKDIRTMITPADIDRSVRQAIHFTWVMLPDDKQNVDEVEKQFLRIVERAFKDMRDDNDAFGVQK